MPFGSHSNSTEGSYEQPFSQAGVMQLTSDGTIEIPTPVPTTITSATAWNSGLIYASGYRYLTVAATLSAGGSLVITRYIDKAGTIVQAVSTTALVAATPLVVNLTDLLPFVTYTIQISATSTTGTLTGFGVLMSAG